MPLATLMRQVNAAAEADLAGQIPVTVTLLEDYSPAWVAPFKPGMARAEDAGQFQGRHHRFSLPGQFECAGGQQSLILSLQKEAWPVRHCR